MSSFAALSPIALSTMSKQNVADAALERLRVRLQQLQGNHQVALGELNAGQPLAPLSQLQSNWNTLQDTLNKIVEEVKNSAATLETQVIIPNAQFPKQSRPFLDTLLRTRYDPSTEDWLEQKLKDARQREDQQDRDKREGVSRALPDKDLASFWRFAAETANSHAVHHGHVILAQADYTWEEVANGIDNVNHGLKRELREPVAEDDSDEDFEDEELDEEADGHAAADKMDVDDKKRDRSSLGGQPLSVDDIQRLMARGECQHEERVVDERGTPDAAKSVSRLITL